MISHSNRFWLVLLVAVPVTSTHARMPSLVQVHDAAQVEVDSTTTWLDRLRLLLRVLIDQLGGEIPASSSLQSQIDLVVGLYLAGGLPSGLGDAEWAELVQSIDSLYTDLLSPPPNAPSLETSQILLALESMWADLGLPPEDLGP